MAASSVEELLQVKDLSEADAEALIEGAQSFVLNREKVPVESAGGEPSAESNPESTLKEAGSPPSKGDPETNDQGDSTPEPVV